MKKNTIVSGAKVRKGFHRIFFIGPKNTDMEQLADSLVKIGDVQGVQVSDHRLGYSARIRFFVDGEPEDVVNFLSKKISPKFGTITKG